MTFPVASPAPSAAAPDFSEVGLRTASETLETSRCADRHANDQVASGLAESVSGATPTPAAITTPASRQESEPDTENTLAGPGSEGSEGTNHGGNLDYAIRLYGGTRSDWVDLSTGINPEPYPLPVFSSEDWASLPDMDARDRLITAARRFWEVPDGAAILPAPGASALIARIPAIARPGLVRIDSPVYGEHAAAFANHGWTTQDGTAPDGTHSPDARVLVHPNNPDGRLHEETDADAPLTVIDESFCDLVPDRSLVHLADRPSVVVLKSFGKFWGLAGLRLGFAIGHPERIARLEALLGPWPVSGPATRIGERALRDAGWVERTRARCAQEAIALDAHVAKSGFDLVGGTNLFRLYSVDDATAWRDRLARSRIWTRTFPWSSRLIRLGLPGAARLPRLTEALS